MFQRRLRLILFSGKSFSQWVTYLQEFQSSGDPENHLHELLERTKEGTAKGKVLTCFDL